MLTGCPMPTTGSMITCSSLLKPDHSPLLRPDPEVHKIPVLSQMSPPARFEELLPNVY